MVFVADERVFAVIYECIFADWTAFDVAAIAAQDCGRGSTPV